MAVLNLHPSRPRRATDSREFAIYERRRAGMSGEIRLDPTLETYEATEEYVSDDDDDLTELEPMQQQMDRLANRLEIEERNNKIAHANMTKLFKQLSIDFQKNGPRSVAFQQQMREEIKAEVQRQVTATLHDQFESKGACDLLEERMHKAIDNELKTRFNEKFAQNAQINRLFVETHQEQLKINSHTTARLTSLETDVQTLQNENDNRQKRKDRSLWKKVRGINAQADAAALPVLLARLQAAE
jgi:hypothetical protein